MSRPPPAPERAPVLPQGAPPPGAVGTAPSLLTPGTDGVGENASTPYSAQVAARLALAGPDPAARLANYRAVQHVLFGESAIDLPRLWWSDVHDVDRFVRLSGFDTDNPLELARLSELHHEATVYLSEVHRYRMPLEIEQAKGVYELFLAASSPASSRVQRFACMTLKVMHILHHISGRELLFNTPISEAQLFETLGAKVFGLIDRMRAGGIGVAEFTAGKKSRTSLTTKLLAKRTNLATHIFDKLRFRIVCSTRDDVVLALVFLLRNLVPFNYVLPEQSQNTVLDQADMARVFGLSPSLTQTLWRPSGRGAAGGRRRDNEFSGLEYRTINFVADIPLRIDEVAPRSAPAVAFVQTEVQLVDAATARQNERGESAHGLYKKRQRARVRSRLESQEGGRAPGPLMLSRGRAGDRQGD